VQTGTGGSADAARILMPWVTWGMDHGGMGIHGEQGGPGWDQPASMFGHRTWGHARVAWPAWITRQMV